MNLTGCTQVNNNQCFGVNSSSPKFIKPTFINSWVTYTPNYVPYYTKDVTGWVYMRGLIMSGTTGTTAFVLPEGFRPEYTEIIITACNAGYGEIRISPNGNVNPTNCAGVLWVSLDQVKFYGYR